MSPWFFSVIVLFLVYLKQSNFITAEKLLNKHELCFWPLHIQSPVDTLYNTLAFKGLAPLQSIICVIKAVEKLVIVFEVFNHGLTRLHNAVIINNQYAASANKREKTSS